MDYFYQSSNENLFNRLLGNDQLFLQNLQYDGKSDICDQFRGMYLKLTQNISQQNDSIRLQRSTQFISQKQKEKLPSNIDKKKIDIFLKKQDRKNCSFESEVRLQDLVLNQELIHPSQTTNNIPKFILKIAKHYFPTDFKDVVQNFPFPKKFHAYLNRISKLGRLPNLKLLHKLLCMKLFVGADQITNRKILWHILSKRKRETVLNNKKVTKKSLYSTSAKIFRLRCRSEILITRTAFK